MYSKSATILNEAGLHARPASVLVQAANKFKSEISIKVNDKTMNAKSIMAILAGSISCGSQVDIVGDGEDEGEAVDSIISLIENKFGE
ncbi:MAG: HPr family phosphocarrier protein [Maledivibacter sp.]|jgi:phosphocarrier protein|nr:HPr family phosphocarrier protein [Maledivibacter sp.]